MNPWTKVVADCLAVFLPIFSTFELMKFLRIVRQVGKLEVTFVKVAKDVELFMIKKLNYILKN